MKNRYLASGSYEEIYLWNTNDESNKQTFIGHTDWICRLALLKNGYLASGSNDRNVKIWNPNDGTDYKNQSHNLILN